MRYPSILQEKENWCVPACLQAIIQSRCLVAPSQQEIADVLGVKEDGLDLSEEVFESFLGPYCLKCDFYNPFIGPIESDLILRLCLTANSDLTVAYDHAELHKTKKRLGQHFSIVTDYDLIRDTVELIDPSQKELVKVKLIALNNAIQAKEDPRYGFYVFS